MLFIKNLHFDSIVLFLEICSQVTLVHVVKGESLLLTAAFSLELQIGNGLNRVLVH